MRLHRLEITAFGPFAGTTTIDFDALSGAGLFLLSGPTGAGKSSVLDAVSFALYGDVPGDRATAKRLRCDTAEPGVAPRVELEVTLSGRRFRIERSPAWTRPKRRGTGVTTEQASVVISEARDGSWLPLSTRLDETGHLVTRLVGMNLPQFCQVALLPQGRFQAFLRARSEERHALLQQVFRTGRFDQVEKWLRERRVELRRASAGHEARVADLVSRTSEVASTPPPDDWALDPSGLRTWVTDLASHNADRVTACAAELELAEAELERRRTQHEDAVHLCELVRRGTEAATALAAASDRSSEIDEARRRLGQAQRAGDLAPVLAMVDDAAGALEVARAADAEARTGLAAMLDRDAATLDPEEVRVQAQAALAEWEQLRPLSQELVRWESEAARLADELESHRVSVQALAGRAESLPAELATARSRLQSAEGAAAEVARFASELTRLQARHEAHERAQRVGAELAPAVIERDSAVATLHAAKEAWLTIREQRLEGMAAEIALALVAGDCCPVCGSCEHPSPAAAGHGTPDAQAERDARAMVDDQEIAVEARRQQVRDLETQLAVAQAEAGPDPDQIAPAVQQAAKLLHEARTRADDGEGAAAEVSTLEAELSELARLRDDAQLRVVRAEADLRDVTRRVTQAQAQLQDLLERWDASDPTSLTERLDQLTAAAAASLRAQSRATVATRTLLEAREAAAAAATRAGFAGLTEAGDALIADAEMAGLADLVRSHDLEVTRLRDVLADHDVTAAMAITPPPDVADVTARLQLAQADATRTRRAHDQAQQACTRVELLGGDLGRALDDWTPLRDELDLTAGLASFVEGKSPDNRLQMRLSAYVLAHRLSQVVDAANLRLWTMSSQRYALVHTGRRGAGESRGGLSLLVRDEWSGEERDPATLSGGESFVVSLALALGLADVIGDEAGGAELHTLFVDEGFGALDADTLDDVMDTLDELRDGGRVVGVVSHVPELQSRIPTQLRVRKGRQGSSTRLSLG